MANTDGNQNVYQSLWPLPPPHWEDAENLSPPSIPTQNVTVFGVPLQQTYKTQLEKAEQLLKERSIDLCASSMYEALALELLSLGNTALIFHPLIDKIESLTQINQLLIVKFLELVKILTKNPSEWAKKYEEIETITFYFHHIMNSYRPHQARQSIITILENQIKRRKQILELLDARLAESREILEGKSTSSVEEGKMDMEIDP